MHLFKKRHQRLVAEAIEILREVKEHINDESDMAWTRYATAKELREEIDQYIVQLEKGKKIPGAAWLHFHPTSTFQEHSIANSWTTEYLALADRFDELYLQLKRRW